MIEIDRNLFIDDYYCIPIVQICEKYNINIHEYYNLVNQLNLPKKSKKKRIVKFKSPDKTIDTIVVKNNKSSTKSYKKQYCSVCNIYITGINRHNNSKNHLKKLNKMNNIENNDNSNTDIFIDDEVENLLEFYDNL